MYWRCEFKSGFSSHVTSMDTQRKSSSSSLPRRVCQCGTRMASIQHDPHIKCASCVGYQCNMTHRCDSCKDWTEEVMSKYLKHQSSLQQKRDCKRRKKALAAAQEPSGVDSENVGTVEGSQISGVSDSDSLGLGSEAVLPVDLDKVVENLNKDWEAKFETLQNTLASSLHQSMSSMFQSFSNNFFSAPHHVPANQLPGKQQTGPSPGDSRHGKGLGRIQEERVHGGMPSLIPSIPEGSGLPGPSFNPSHIFPGINVDSQDFIGGDDEGDGASGNDEGNDGEEGDDGSGVEPGHPPAQEIDPNSVQFDQLFNLVVGFFPQATVDSPESPPRSSSVTEGIYIPQPSTSKERKRFVRFGRFQDMRNKIQKEVSSKASEGQKSFRYLLNHERGAYQLAGPDTNKAPKPNGSLARLTSPKKVTEKMAISIPLEETRKLESLIISARESQSFSCWLFGALLNYVKSAGFTPPDVALFERLCSSITGAQIRSNSFLHKMQAYLTMSRRKLYLSHAPTSLSDDQRNRLLSSPVFEPDLFDPAVLESVISEH